MKSQQLRALADDIAKSFAGNYYAKMGTGDIKLLSDIIVRKLGEHAALAAIPPRPTHALKPCVHCGEEMIVREHSAFHPTMSRCWLTDLELHEVDYDSWNTRTTPAPADDEVERVARKMYETQPYELAGSGVQSWEMCCKLWGYQADNYRRLARAAIAAIRGAE